MRLSPLSIVAASLTLALATVAVFYDVLTGFPYGLVRDDAYFYAQVAYNLGTRFHSTFDGFATTDGYHLLWCWLLGLTSLVTSAFSLSKDTHLCVMLVFNFFLIYLVVLCCGRSWLERLVLFGLIVMGSLLMETLLLSMVLLALIHFNAREGAADGEPRRQNILAFLLLLIPLLRVDASVIALAFLGFYLVSGRYRVLLKSTAALGLGLATHLAGMKLTAGSWVSVSSYLKSSWADRTDWLHGNLLANVFHGQKWGLAVNPLFAVLALLAVASAVVIATRAPRDRRLLLAAAWCGVGGFTVTHLWLHEVRPWYYVPGFLVYARIFFLYSEEAPVWWTKGVRLATALVAAGSLAFYGYNVARLWDERARVAQFLERTRQIVGEDERIFQVDGSGYTGYHLGRSITNGDGLMNSHEYARLATSGRLRLLSYLRENGIGYIIANKPQGRGIAVQAHASTVALADVELLYTKPPPNPYHFSRYRLYRVKH